LFFTSQYPSLVVTFVVAVFPFGSFAVIIAVPFFLPFNIKCSIFACFVVLLSFSNLNLCALFLFPVYICSLVLFSAFASVTSRYNPLLFYLNL